MNPNQYYPDNSYFVSDDNLNFHAGSYPNYDQSFDSYSQPAQLNQPGASSWQPAPTTNFTGEEDEPPLLEELGIDLNKIVIRLMHSLDPTGKCGVVLGDYDVIGPIALYLTYTSLLLLAGGKLMFSYIYGLAVLTSVCMYGLLWAMTDSSEVTLTSTFSVLGYSFTPVVLVALLAVFVNLKNIFGAIIVLAAVVWSSMNAARVFVAMFGNSDQKYLMAYPCAIICALPSEVQQPILVCTAHIHWDPEFCDVKLIQIMMLSNELNTILEDANRNYRNVNHHQPPIQLLLCGDFNSLPDSGVIEFLSAGKVSSDHQDFKDLQYKTLLHKISTCDRPNEFMHSFKLSSAYENIMPFTNYTFNFKGIIDYIFYTRQTMTPLGLLGPLAPEWFKDNKVLGCPHPHIPSDHFPLLVEFELSPNAHQSNSNGLIGRR